LIKPAKQSFSDAPSANRLVSFADVALEAIDKTLQAKIKKAPFLFT
jgi:hypothetical protein